VLGVSQGVKTMKNLALVLATAFAALAGVNTASAQSVSWSGSWTIQNSAPYQINFDGSTYPSSVTFAPALPANIAASSFGFPGMTRTTTGTVWANSFTYKDPTTGYGCIYTTLGSYTRRTARYSYTFSSTPLVSGQPAVTCAHTGSWNSTTGNFNATATFTP
jgi:hypothetical protein